MESGEQRDVAAGGPVRLFTSIAVTFGGLGAIAYLMEARSLAEILVPMACVAWTVVVPFAYGWLWDSPRTTRADRLLAKILVGLPLLLFLVELVTGGVRGGRILRVAAFSLGICGVVLLLFMVGRAAGRWRSGRALNRE